MFLLFDIGGTKTRIALSTDLQSFGKVSLFATPQDFEQGVDLIVTEANKLLTESADKKLLGFAGCAPGPMDKQKTMLTGAPNLPLWNGKPLVSKLKEKLQCEMGILENDAATVGLGEVHFGAGRGQHIVVYITVSTGVGGARIVAGKIDPSAEGFEPGHQIIVPAFAKLENNILDRGQNGYLEDFIGGHSLQKKFGKLPTNIKDPAVWEACAEVLAYGLHNTIVHWSPDVVVLGGSLIVKPDGMPLDRVEYYLKQITKIFSPPPVVKAELEDVAGLYGAMILVTQVKA